MEINKKNKYEKTLIAVDSKNSIVKKEKNYLKHLRKKTIFIWFFQKILKKLIHLIFLEH